jgi:polyhydroxybutyrate depolymerase
VHERDEPDGAQFHMRQLSCDRSFKAEEAVMTTDCRSVLALLALFVLTFAFGADSQAREPLPEGLIERSMSTAGGPRYYLEFAPAQLSPGSALVVLLHGGGQSMREIFKTRQTGTRRWLDLAQRDGFLLLVPNAVNAENGDPAGDQQNWNDLRADSEVADSDADDVGFILALVAEARARHGIDPQRVYVTGASNGGMMTYRLLQERPEVFAAGAAFIANLPAASVPAPTGRSRLMIVNGTADPLMPDAGGMVARNRGIVRSTADTVEYWRAAWKLGDPPSVTVLPNVAADDGCRVTASVWPKDGRAILTYLRLEGGGHTMPSMSPMPMYLSPVARRIIGPQCRDLEGADAAWAFFEAR